MEATILFVAVAAVILLAVTSIRYGVDSREGFIPKDRELASRGSVRAQSSATRRRQPSIWAFMLPPILPVPRKCVSATCGA
jgi:hypothetical protein